MFLWSLKTTIYTPILNVLSLTYGVKQWVEQNKLSLCFFLHQLSLNKTYIFLYKPTPFISFTYFIYIFKSINHKRIFDFFFFNEFELTDKYSCTVLAWTRNLSRQKCKKKFLSGQKSVIMQSTVFLNDCIHRNMNNTFFLH